MLWTRAKRTEVARELNDPPPVWANEHNSMKTDSMSPVINIITANIHDLESRIEQVISWDADIIALQETKLAPHQLKDVHAVAKKQNWTLLHGRPCPSATAGDARKRRRTSAVQAANSGGVAILIKHPRQPIEHEYNDRDKRLHDSGRWQRAKVPLSHTAGNLTISCIYGISGARSNERKQKMNEALLSDAIAEVIEAGSEPRILVGDGNIDPEESKAIASAVEAGCLVDVGHAWANNIVEDEEGNAVKKPTPTYSSGTPLRRHDWTWRVAH